MQQWEYSTVVVRLTLSQGKLPGYFNRAQSVRNLSEESELELNRMGALGWELVNLVLLELGGIEGGPTYATAVFKRPLDLPAEG